MSGCRLANRKRPILHFHTQMAVLPDMSEELGRFGSAFLDACEMGRSIRSYHGTLDVEQLQHDIRASKI
jgi:hypothetical protein